jgi:hypothetical protein
MLRLAFWSSSNREIFGRMVAIVGLLSAGIAALSVDRELSSVSEGVLSEDQLNFHTPPCAVYSRFEAFASKSVLSSYLRLLSRPS